MAELLVDDTHVHVCLSPLEKVGAVHGNLSFRHSALAAVRATDQPFAELRGIRAPGTGLPRRVALGTWRGRHGKDFVAIRGSDPQAIVIEFAGAGWARVVLGVADAAPLLAQLRSVLPAAGAEPSA